MIQNDGHSLILDGDEELQPVSRFDACADARFYRTINLCPTNSPHQQAISPSLHAICVKYTSPAEPEADFVAVDDLTLDVPRGQIFGFLGPNGAGKTTTINMLLGNVYPTAGEGFLLGAPLGDLTARRALGFLPEKFQFHEFLTAEEFLDLHGRLYGMSPSARRAAAADALERVGLTSRRRSKIGEFSKGMQQRVGLAQAILNKPELVILDEPTSALDPLGRRDVRRILSELRAEGVTIFLNSHLLSEIEMTCDQVAIIKAGRVVRQGTVAALTAASSLVELRLGRGDVTDDLRQDLQALSVEPVAWDGESAVLRVPNEDAAAEAARIVVNHGARLLSLVQGHESLEDLFIRVVEDADPGAS